MTDTLNTNTHSDIKQNGMIINRLPSGLKPYYYLARLDRPIGIWLLLLPGLWSIVLASGGIMGLGSRGWLLVALFGGGAVVMRAAGCVINDIWDRDLDQQVERTKLRPLAAGTLSLKQAILFLLLLLALGLLVLSQMNAITIMLGFASMPLIILYPLMKRVTWWPQAFLGLTFNFSALMGWSAVTGELSSTALLLYLGGVFWTLGYDTVYAHQDKEDDALAGIKSTALKFGEQSREWVAGFYGMGFVCLVWSVMSAGGGFVELFALSVPLAYGFGLIKRWQVDDAENSLLVFKASKNLGLMVLAALAISGLF